MFESKCGPDWDDGRYVIDQRTETTNGDLRAFVIRTVFHPFVMTVLSQDITDITVYTQIIPHTPQRPSSAFITKEKLTKRTTFSLHGIL